MTIQINQMPPPLSNTFECPRCGATLKIPIAAPGQLELFAPLCVNCWHEMKPKNA